MSFMTLCRNGEWLASTSTIDDAITIMRSHGPGCSVVSEAGALLVILTDERNYRASVKRIQAADRETRSDVARVRAGERESGVRLRVADVVVQADEEATKGAA